jgi:hypothetical protein
MFRLNAILLLFLVVSHAANAQYANDWIQFGQSYVKVATAKKGLYRISFAQLQAAGLSISNPSNLQLFHRGDEHALIVGSDFVEFIGKRNDGILDRELYGNQSHQPHALYNLFSDTTSFYITQGAFPGKRVPMVDLPGGTLTAKTYVTKENELILKSSWSSGKDHGNIFLTVFDEGEGWMGSIITNGQPVRYDTIREITNAVTAGGKPVLDMAVTGRGWMQHGIEIVGGVSGRVITSFSLDGFSTHRVIQELEWSDISAAGEFPVGIEVSLKNASEAKASVNFIKIRFPQATAAQQANDASSFSLQPSSGNTLLEFQSANSSSRLFNTTHGADIEEIKITHAATPYAVAPASVSTAEFVMTSSFISAEAQPVTFAPVNPLDYNYIIITHPSLRSPSSGYADPVEAYATYRASPQGGSYQPLVVDIGQLYDQFNYGEASPLAIFRFMKYLAARNIPEYLFLIGKGLDVDYNYGRNPAQAVLYKSLVPSAGIPASDMFFTAGLDGNANAPAVPTGRLTAMKSSEVAAYLNKVKEAEARPFDDLRRKNVLHLSGGIYPGEAQNFRSHLQVLASRAETFYLGGHVDAVAKQSTDVKLINISEEVNQGVSLVTFFGHASTVALDFDVGNVTDEVMGYDNKGKYPVLLVNGCYAGSAFRYGELFGENWVNTPNKGAIGYIAHSALGFVIGLKKYSQLFYEVGFSDPAFITTGLGDVQREVSKRFLSTSAYASDISQVQQMVLLGDPAVRLFGAAAPDYHVTDNLITISSLDESPVTVASDSFAINFVIKNFGIAGKEPLQAQLIRTLADGSVLYHDTTYSPVLYSDTLSFIVRDKITNGFGMNTFEIRIDGQNAVEELREDNNSAFIDVFIPENGMKNLYPPPYAIVNQTNVSLTAQHSDLHSGARAFEIEIDSTYNFTSPFKQSFSLTADVLVTQTAALPANDTTVYYWRSRIAQPLENESPDWTTSSFTYIKNGVSGWAQAEYFQHTQNTLSGLIGLDPQKKFGFNETVTPVHIKNFSWDSGTPAASVSVKIDEAEYHLTNNGYGCRENTINLIAFDKISTVPYAGIHFEWFNSGGRSCGREPWAINSFKVSELVTGNNDDLIQYIDNIQAGDSVVLFSIGNAGYESWPQAAKVKLGELGISVGQLDAIAAGEAVIIFGRKGSTAGSARMYRGSGSGTGDLDISATITGRRDEGQIVSAPIGPAISWGNIHFKLSELEPSDNAKISLLGVRQNGTKDLLIDSVESGQNISSVNTSLYRTLRLTYTTTDTVNLTPVVLKNWLVTYEPVPEGLVFYASGNVQQVRLQEGVPWSGTYGFANVSDVSFNDSLDVRLRIHNHRGIVSERHFRILSPAPGDTTSFDAIVETVGLAGTNDVEVFVNAEQQPELYYDNNLFLMQEKIVVVEERFNPVIDVTVDGRHIEQNEYVSTDPVIRISIWDENRILLKNDTVGVEMFLSMPCSTSPCAFKRIYFSDANVLWTGASADDDYLISFKPGSLGEGEYMFRITATDRTGNEAGDGPYEISFRVADENRTQISDPYPNPATGDVNLRVVISGPADLIDVSIQFLTLQGEPALEFIAPSMTLHTGTNVLRISTQEAGISPGVYLYRIQSRNGTEQIDKYGKMVLIR